MKPGELEDLKRQIAEAEGRGDFAASLVLKSRWMERLRQEDNARLQAQFDTMFNRQKEGA